MHAAVVQRWIVTNAKSRFGLSLKVDMDQHCAGARVRDVRLCYGVAPVL